MTSPSSPMIAVRFYRTAAGGEPVREWLKSLDAEDRRAIGLDLQRIQYRWPVGMPLCRALGRGLWEVRTRLPSHKIARVIFCQESDVLIALNGFVKKTQKTPIDEIQLASKRQMEIEHGQ